jgi:hypothetical protein
MKPCIIDLAKAQSPQRKEKKILKNLCVPGGLA